MRSIPVGSFLSSANQSRRIFMNVGRVLVWIVGLLAVGVAPALGQFVASFEGASVSSWTHRTGDGQATMTFRAAEERAVMHVDATADRHNIWWAFVAREVSPAIDLVQLSQPTHELRVTARVRPSHAPRRVNLHVNTQKTTDFHTHLAEYDLPDTTGWHTISMTTDGFEVAADDTVTAQLAMMDWGTRQYRLEIDSFAVEVVERATVGPNFGTVVPYPLPTPDPDTLVHHVPASESAVVNADAPELNLSDWHAVGDTVPVPVLTVAPLQYVLFRWDREALPDGTVKGPGVLELVPHSVQRAETEIPELGRVRVVEILGGTADWTSDDITFAGFTGGELLHSILNPQMIVDVDVSSSQDRLHIPISKPVLRRVLDGRTRGLALRPLGPISASFYVQEQDGSRPAPTLHLTTASSGPQ